MFRFIHIADVHLDTPFQSQQASLRTQLKAGLRLAFQRIIGQCIQEQVHALLIAGDLFDHRLLSFQTEQFLIQELNRLKPHGIQVYYATGNHDPGDRAGWLHRIPWPDHVKVFSTEQVETCLVTDREGAVVGKVVGVGHATDREARNLIVQFPQKDDFLPWVGLAHAFVTTGKQAENHDRYLPCTLEDLEEKHYDYWALGHIHQRQRVGVNQNIHYSGNLQGRHPNETGEKGGLLVTVGTAAVTRVAFLPVAPLRWEILEISGLESIFDSVRLKEKLALELEGFLEQHRLQPEALLLRLVLTGRSPLRHRLKREEDQFQLAEALQESLGLLSLELKLDQLKPALEVENYRQGRHVLQKTLAMLETLAAQETIPAAFEGLVFAGASGETEQDRLSYLKKLLAGLEEEAVERMAGEADVD